MSRRGREAAVSPITASPCRMSASSFASRGSTALVWPQAAHRSVSGPNHLGSALGHIRAVDAQPGCPCHHDPRPEHSISTAKAPAKEEIRRGRSRQHRHLNAMDEDGGREASLGDEEMAMP